MKEIIKIWFIASTVLVLTLPLLAPAAVQLFDKEIVELGELQEGKTYSKDITLQNTSGQNLTILDVQTSCGCTEMKPLSSTVLAGEEITFTLSTDTSGKKGPVTKYIDIFTSASNEPFELKIKFIVAHKQSGKIDSAAIFRGKCTSCHIGENVDEKYGAKLYDSICYMCHKEPSALPKYNRDMFIETVSLGITNSSMPGFAITGGGPLSEKQIESLADYYFGSK